mmetsp:Transcript_10891/g.30844  ORF Transcript_10891/g.30844 Transcript_10891/m.30844 type:complete len:256 (-) Transcript_10891:249-1016(-)
MVRDLLTHHALAARHLGQHPFLNCSSDSLFHLVAWPVVAGVRKLQHSHPQAPRSLLPFAEVGCVCELTVLDAVHPHVPRLRHVGELEKVKHEGIPKRGDLHRRLLELRQLVGKVQLGGADLPRQPVHPFNGHHDLDAHLLSELHDGAGVIKPARRSPQVHGLEMEVVWQLCLGCGRQTPFPVLLGWWSLQEGLLWSNSNVEAVIAQRGDANAGVDPLLHGGGEGGGAAAARSPDHYAISVSLRNLTPKLRRSWSF